MRIEPRFPRKSIQTGISLVELIMFIVIVGLGIVGILSVMNVTTKASADPMLRKQALAIAESLLEEIELQPFTLCDPDDDNARTALTTADCATVQGLGKTPGETRYTDPRFDNVGDYHLLNITGIRDIENNPIADLTNFTADVTMAAVGGAFGLPDDNAVLQINIAVTLGPVPVSPLPPNPPIVSLTGYRFRYAPRAVP